MYDSLGDVRFPYKIAAKFPKADAIFESNFGVWSSPPQDKTWGLLYRVYYPPLLIK